MGGVTLRLVGEGKVRMEVFEKLSIEDMAEFDAWALSCSRAAREAMMAAHDARDPEEGSNEEEEE